MQANGLAALAVGLWCVWSTDAAASDCTQSLSRENVVRCALAASDTTRAEREGVAAIGGRLRTASGALPSNPVLSVSGAKRSTRQQDATNWYGQLSQEVEIAGQRGAKQRAIAAERRAQQSTTGALEREVAAAALRAYFEVLAARDALALAERMEQTLGAATAAAQAAAGRGLSAGIDADLAELASVRLAQARLEAERRFASTAAQLTSLVGVDPSLTLVHVEGELTPLPQTDGTASQLARQATEKRPEIMAAEATRTAFEGWADAYHRARIPNVTLSVFAQRDGFNERVLGAGLALPVPLPGSIGRNFSGEIRENAALARRADALHAEAVREVRLEVVRALYALEAARAQAALFNDERVVRATQSLTAIAQQIAAGRLAIGSVLVAQQALISFLNEHVVAKLALCLASVELVRATGSSLEGGTR